MKGMNEKSIRISSKPKHKEQDSYVEGKGLSKIPKPKSLTPLKRK